MKLPGNVSVQDAIDLYKQDPDVLYAEPNYILRLNAKADLTATPNDPSFGSLYGLTKINAPVRLEHYHRQQQCCSRHSRYRLRL